MPTLTLAGSSRVDGLRGLAQGWSRLAGVGRGGSSLVEVGRKRHSERHRCGHSIVRQLPRLPLLCSSVSWRIPHCVCVSPRCLSRLTGRCRFHSCIATPPTGVGAERLSSAVLSQCPQHGRKRGDEHGHDEDKRRVEEAKQRLLRAREDLWRPLLARHARRTTSMLLQAHREAREAARALACHVARAWEGHEEGKGRARAHGGS